MIDQGIKQIALDGLHPLGRFLTEIALAGAKNLAEKEVERFLREPFQTRESENTNDIRQVGINFGEGIEKEAISGVFDWAALFLEN